MGDEKGLVKDLTKDFELDNDRGTLVQLVHSGYSQVNAVSSYANTSRGGHMHKSSREAFFIFEGCVVVELWKKDNRIQKKYSKGDFFEIQPGVMHSLDFPTDCMMIVLYDVPIESDDGSKDIFYEEED